MVKFDFYCMESLDLSIVVPVYNVEKYLDRCFNSLLRIDCETPVGNSNKGLRYEIVAVDDGSTDRSSDICDDYAARFVTVRVVHRANGGLSAARNSGLLLARGQYVLFVDSDDYIEPQKICGLLNNAFENGSDLVVFGLSQVDDSGKASATFMPAKPENGGVVTGATYLSDYFDFRCYAWQFLYRREFLEDNAFRFKEGLLFKDIEWTPRVLVKAQKMSVYSEVVYDYYFRQGSISRSYSAEKIRKQNQDKLFIIDSLQNLPRQAGATTVESDESCATTVESDGEKRVMAGVESWCRAMIASVAEGMLTTTARYLYEDVPEVISALKKRKLLPIDSSRMTKTGKRRVMIINLFSARFYCWVMSLLK